MAKVSLLVRWTCEKKRILRVSVLLTSPLTNILTPLFVRSAKAVQ